MRLRLLARTSPSLATSRRFAVMNVGRRAGGGGHVKHKGQPPRFTAEPARFHGAG